jgi:hypothetical protein
MKVIKPFFLGTLGGLALAFGLLIGLYFSPIREFVYFQADPEIADVRSKLSQYRDWLSQADFYIVEKGPETSDSLQTAQTLAWREYKKWRNHLGELARLHDRPTAEGFWTWCFSLRYYAIPVAIFLALLPALWLGWRARNRFRPRSVRLSSKGMGRRQNLEQNNVLEPSAAVSEARNEALSSLQDTLKKIAQISGPASQTASPVPREEKFEPPPTKPIPVSTHPETALIEVVDQKPRVEKEPETKFIPIFTEKGLTKEEWAPSDLQSSASSGAATGSLSMEDEDGEDDAQEGRGILHPTTELEKVERRKEQVLKLARKGMTSSEISRRMRISQDQVEFIIRLRREKG